MIIFVKEISISAKKVNIFFFKKKHLLHSPNALNRTKDKEADDPSAIPDCNQQLTVLTAKIKDCKNVIVANKEILFIKFSQ